MVVVLELAIATALMQPKHHYVKSTYLGRMDEQPLVTGCHHMQDSIDSFCFEVLLELKKE